MSGERVLIKGMEGNLSYRVWQNGRGLWIGVCDALQITTQADTWPEMVDAIQEDLDMIFQDLVDDGELEQFLADRGWFASGPYDEGTKLDVPFGLELVSANA
jgi:predicted RNase H-like HicB family nuclease